MAELAIRGARKDYGRTRVLHEIDIEVADGEFLVLVGPSGCGKSTLLNMIAGLESITEGSILIDGVVVDRLDPADRDIAMVFQSYALYPTMTVAGNIGFGLEMRGTPKAERRAAVERVAKLLQIEPLLDRKPAQLSGGQRQRVAMGRALVRDPKIFLFDEPLSNLDAKLRVEMRTEIKKLHARLGTTIVYVTHDQIEAMTMATRIAVMNGGYLQQLGTPKEIYDRPANVFVATFMGSPPMNLLPATVRGDGAGARLEIVPDADAPDARVPGEGAGTALPDAPLPPTVAPEEARDGRRVLLGLRPEWFDEGGAAPDGPVWSFSHPVEVLEPTGPDVLALLSFGERGITEHGAGELTVRLDADHAARPGDVLHLHADLAKASLFDAEGGQSLLRPAGGEGATAPARADVATGATGATGAADAAGPGGAADAA